MGKGDDPNRAGVSAALIDSADSTCPVSWGLPPAVRAPEATAPGLTAAAGTLADAMANGQTIAVFCDYDPDGTFAGELIRLAFATRTTTAVGISSRAQIRFGYARREEGLCQLLRHLLCVVVCCCAFLLMARRDKDE